MRKEHLVRRAIAASSIEVQYSGEIARPNVFIFGRHDASWPEIEASAARLFDHALKYRYGAEQLYRQQCAWHRAKPERWEDVPEPIRIAMTLFAAAVPALAPFLDKEEAKPEPPVKETRSHGFDKGLGEDGYDELRKPRAPAAAEEEAAAEPHPAAADPPAETVEAAIVGPAEPIIEDLPPPQKKRRHK